MDRKFIYRYVITLLMLACVFGGKAQLTLTLERTITLAADSSLDAFRYKNMYLAGYWEYRTYKAGRLPSLTLNLTPAQYRRYFTQRYDLGADCFVCRRSSQTGRKLLHPLRQMRRSLPRRTVAVQHSFRSAAQRHLTPPRTSRYGLHRMRLLCLYLSGQSSASGLLQTGQI